MTASPLRIRNTPRIAEPVPNSPGHLVPSTKSVTSRNFPFKFKVLNEY